LENLKVLKNKLFKTFWGELLLILLLICGLTIVKMIPSEKTVENNQNSNTYFPRIFEKENFISSFTAQYNNLKRVDVLFKNPNLESRDDIEIIVLEGKKIIFQQNYNGYNFGDTSHAIIDFPEIKNSKDKEYLVAVRLINRNDGKLQLGIKNGDINFIQYYSEKLSLTEAVKSSVEEIKNIFRKEAVVLITPMFLWGIFLW